MALEIYGERFKNIEEAREFVKGDNIKCIGIHYDTQQDLENQPHSHTISIVPETTVIVSYQKTNEILIK